MKYLEFFKTVEQQLADTLATQSTQITDAADAMATSIQKGGVIHVFGCGHSQMFAQELFYRAGGLVPINALLIPHLSIYPTAKLSTFQERVEGFSQVYLDMVNTSEVDTMIVVSVSGRNAAPIDMALAAKAKGMKVIALVSKSFSQSVASRHSSGKSLYEVADIVIDILCVAGDAAMSSEGLTAKYCGTSTILGMTILEACVAQTVENLLQRGITPPIWVSSNLDEGDDINLKYIHEYRDKLSCL